MLNKASIFIFMIKMKHLKNNKRENCQVLKICFINNADIQQIFVIFIKRTPPQHFSSLKNEKIGEKNGIKIFHQFSNIPRIRRKNPSYWISIYEISSKQLLPMAKNFLIFSKMKSLEITILLTEIILFLRIQGNIFVFPF